MWKASFTGQIKKKKIEHVLEVENVWKSLFNLTHYIYQSQLNVGCERCRRPISSTANQTAVGHDWTKLSNNGASPLLFSPPLFSDCLWTLVREGYAYSSWLSSSSMPKPLAEANKRPSPLFGANAWVRDTRWILIISTRQTLVRTEWERKRKRERQKLITPFFFFCFTCVAFWVHTFQLQAKCLVHSSAAGQRFGNLLPHEIWHFVSGSQSK